MHTFVAQVATRLRERVGLREGASVLVGVSGGVDSMVLLHVLHGLAPRHRWRLVVAHFNHRLRGVASGADERFVRRAAERLGLECVTERGAVRRLSRDRGVSVEMAARELRHEFLARTALRLGLDAVALAHHADDQVELFFLRLLRGAAGGIGGMDWRSISPALATVTLVRPLLDVPKAALRDYAQEMAIQSREDASNESVDILRNRIRHELLPTLRRHYQPGLDRTVPRVMEVAKAESDLARELARKWGQDTTGNPFSELPIAVQRQWMCKELERVGVPPDFVLVERLRLKPNVRHSWREAWLVFEPATARVVLERAVATDFSANSFSLELQGARGTVRFAEVDIRWQRRASPRRKTFKPSLGQERFDADVVGTQIVLRHWQRGDRFQPSGMPKPVKIQDLFTNTKVPVMQRRSRLVALASDGRIFWVEGLRIAEPFKLSTTSQRELVWNWRRHQPRIEPGGVSGSSFSRA